jgi:transposase
VPSEDSTGESRTQGGVTKTGNSHARRLLIEAAWHHRPPYRASAQLRRRWQRAGRGGGACGQRQPAAAREVAVLRRPAQATCGRQYRHRPGAGRLVLGAGGHAHRPVRPPGSSRPEALRARVDGQRRSCSLRCACSTLTLAPLPEQRAHCARTTGPGVQRPLMSIEPVTAA